MSASTVWLASYPKSGNTWIRAMLAALGERELDVNALGGGNIASARAPLERLTGLVSSELRPAEVALLRPLVDAAAAPNAPFRTRKIHDGLFTGAGGAPIVSPEATRAAIYVVRDPRDVAVSYAHHLGSTLEHATNAMADPDGRMAGRRRAPAHQFRQQLGTWSQHVEGWLDHDLFEVVLLRYEDLTDDPHGQLRRIVDTLGRDATDEQVAAAVDAASFDNLRAQEEESGFRERPRPDHAFFRRGVAGCWRDELPSELARRIEADHGTVMKRLGYL